MDTPNVTNPVNPPDSTNNTKVPKKHRTIDVAENNVMKRLKTLESASYYFRQKLYVLDNVHNSVMARLQKLETGENSLMTRVQQLNGVASSAVNPYVSPMSTPPNSPKAWDTPHVHFSGHAQDEHLPKGHAPAAPKLSPHEGDPQAAAGPTRQQHDTRAAARTLHPAVVPAQLVHPVVAPTQLAVGKPSTHPVAARAAAQVSQQQVRSGKRGGDPPRSWFSQWGRSSRR